MKQLLDRWAPLTGLVSVACSLVGVMLALNQPQDKDSNAKIVAYFANHSHRVHGVIGFFVFLAGLLFLLAFLAALRERLLAAEGQPGRLSALAFGAGIASLPLVGGLDAACERGQLRCERVVGIPGRPEHVPDARRHRLLRLGGRRRRQLRRRLGHLGGRACGPACFPRWYAQIGILAGVVQLFGFFFFPFFVWWLWIIVTSILLISRPSPAAAPVAQPAL